MQSLFKISCTILNYTPGTSVKYKSSLSEETSLSTLLSPGITDNKNDSNRELARSQVHDMSANRKRSETHLGWEHHQQHIKGTSLAILDPSSQVLFMPFI